jgi:hypothetical protein
MRALHVGHALAHQIDEHVLERGLSLGHGHQPDEWVKALIIG